MPILRIRTIQYLVNLVRTSYFLTPVETAFHRRFSRGGRLQQEPEAPLVLVQAPHDYYYFCLFGEIIAGLRKVGPLRIQQYTVRDLRLGSTQSLRKAFWNLVAENCFSDWKWQRLYRAFAEGIAYRHAELLAPWTAVGLWWRAWQLWKKVKSPGQLAALEVDGIIIGDLVIDSYVRFKPAKSLILGDRYLLVVIRQALKNSWLAFRHFTRAQPDLLLTSYTTYIRHGIPARVAVKLGIRVLAFGNFQELSTPITPLSVWQTKDGRFYKRDFLLLPNQQAAIADARKMMEARISGVIDKSTSYMKISAYSEGHRSDFDVQGMPIIFLHDFFDSIHIYRSIVFHDFWDWICFTIETLRDAGIRFAVKPHPNQVSDSGNVLKLLLDKYPDLNLVPEGVSNQQLVRSGMACAVTVYGTIASEMAYMGIPTISCGDNPHVSFSFCHTAKSPGEYAELLQNCRSLPHDSALFKEESCAFYYMHVLNYDGRDRVLSDKAAELRAVLMFTQPLPPPQDIADALDRFAAGPEFESYCRGLYSDLAQKKVCPAITPTKFRSTNRAL